MKAVSLVKTVALVKGEIYDVTASTYNGWRVEFPCRVGSNHQNMSDATYTNSYPKDHFRIIGE